MGSGPFGGLVRLHGTHGGLHRRVSETFVRTTSHGLASPLDLAGVSGLRTREFNWQAGDRR